MSKKHPLVEALNRSMIKDVPSYGNKFFYSLGFLTMIAFVMLIITGVIMSFYGPAWWLTGGVGKYMRSVHLWATQAFVLFMVLHLLIVFFTSGYKKPRRLTWMLGVLMLFVGLAETEFGYALRGDFSSQWRSLQGADFYNGGGIGNVINPLNYKQIYGIHVVVVPLVIIGLLALHYLLVRVLGIAKPYRKDVSVQTVPANHALLFGRGGALVVLILLLGLLLPSPYIKPTSIESVARQDPLLVSKTLVAEFDGSSDTATYLDNINPYTYDLRKIYIDQPYQQYLQTQAHQTDALMKFNAETPDIQKQQLKTASDYLAQDKPDAHRAPVSPVMTIVSSLTTMAQAGLYETAIAAANSNGVHADESTYSTRFLADTGVLEAKATALSITTDQYGMIREESGKAPGAWWLSPIGILNHTVLSGDDNGDRDAAIIFGSLLLTMLAFPFIPYLNQLPDKLKIYKLIWYQKYK
ncbi:MAG: cytochrome b N-terminal domain-containing protein [Patescibacteria group bacterium]|nr:cytochrome b N-terminal domain-containing protein [Patescibacteria group bacterium]